MEEMEESLGEYFCGVREFSLSALDVFFLHLDDLTPAGEGFPLSLVHGVVFEGAHGQLVASYEEETIHHLPLELDVLVGGYHPSLALEERLEVGEVLGGEG